MYERVQTNLIVPDVFSWIGMMGKPFESSAFVMSNTAKDMEIVDQREASARNIPGQIRRPNPKHAPRGSR